MDEILSKEYILWLWMDYALQRDKFLTASEENAEEVFCQ